MNKEVIFFDAGGVLFDTFVKGDDRIRNLLIERGYTMAAIDHAIKSAMKIELSFITNWDDEEQYYKSYYGAIANELGEPLLANELFLFTHFATHCKLFPEVLEVLQEVSKEYRLAVISNAMPSMDWIFDNLGIRKFFESIILSSTVKEEKPGDAIYKIAMKQMKITPENSIFIDDKLENVEAAKALGINGLQLDRTVTDLKNLIKDQHLLSRVQII